MWQRRPKKTIYTLNIDQGYPKEITDMTYPLIQHYAYKIGADFYEITERKFPEWTVTYEKCQVYQLGQEHQNDWNLFIDCDAIIHPDTPDITAHLPKDMVAHNGSDLSSIRWRENRVFQRDGRKIGSASWLCVASDWCIELFAPMTDMTPDETYFQIFPTLGETANGVVPSRLVEDYVFSYNIAKFGLKFASFRDILANCGLEKANLFWHIYAVPLERKIIEMKQVLKMWGLAE